MAAAWSRIASILSSEKKTLTYFNKTFFPTVLINTLSDDLVLLAEPPLHNSILNGGQQVQLSKSRALWQLVLIRTNKNEYHRSQPDFYF